MLIVRQRTRGAGAIHYNAGDYDPFFAFMPHPPPCPASPRILIIRTSSLGDVVYASAVLADIRRTYPDAKIDWVVEEAFADIPRLAGARRVILFALRRWRKNWRHMSAWRELAVFRRTLRKESYDLAIDLNEQVKSALIGQWANAKERHGFDRASIREPLATFFYQKTHSVPRTLHFVERCRLLAAAALGYDIHETPRWQWAFHTLQTLPKSPYVMLLTATSRDDKLWPEDHWRAVIADCAASGLAVLLPWGNADEQARCQRLAQGFTHTQILPHLSLTSLGQFLQQARWTIGVDTGLTHYAAALGTPTVAIFTATSPRQLGVAVQGAHAQDIGEHGVMPDPAQVLRCVKALPDRKNREKNA